jgi:hypothetical protein
MTMTYFRLILSGAMLCGLYSVGFGQEKQLGQNLPQAAFQQRNEDKAVGDDWLQVTPEGAGASVRMPGTPVASQRTLSVVAGTTTTVNLNVLQVSPTNSYVFAFNKVTPKPGESLKADNVLEGGVKGAVARTLGELVTVKKIEVNKAPGRDFTFECVYGDKDPGIRLRITSRLVLVGDTLYQMTYVTRADEHNEADAQKFVESFQR